MDKEKEIIRKGLLCLLEEKGGEYYKIPTDYEDTFKALCHGLKHNSGKFLGGKCGNVSALLRDFFRAYFRHEGIDGDCLRVSSADNEHVHCYNLVRMNDTVLILDGTAGQFIRPLKEAFPDLGVFIGARQELEKILSDAIENSKEVLREEWPEVGFLSDAGLDSALGEEIIRNECFRLFSQSGSVCVIATPFGYGELWQRAWGSSSIPVTEDDRPNDPLRWGSELDAKYLSRQRPDEPRQTPPGKGSPRPRREPH